MSEKRDEREGGDIEDARETVRIGGETVRAETRQSGKRGREQNEKKKERRETE